MAYVLDSKSGPIIHDNSGIKEFSRKGNVAVGIDNSLNSNHENIGEHV